MLCDFFIKKSQVLVGTLELEGNGQRVPYGHSLTILATGSELGQRLADANGLLVEIPIH